VGGELAGARRAIRRRARAAREAMGPGERRGASTRVTRALLRLDAVRSARVVMAYAAFRGEVDLSAFVEELLASGVRVVLPRTLVEERRLEPYPVGNLDELEPGAYGIPEPPARGKPVPPALIDVVIVPGVAFDPRGNRLGYGAGYYDRFLSTIPPHTVAVAPAFEVQVVEGIPARPDDVPVDVIVTETRVIMTERGKFAAARG